MTTDDDPGSLVIPYLVEVARSVPELGLRAADVDVLAQELSDCSDIDSSALREDSDLLRSRIARAAAVPTALEQAAAAMPAAWSGSGGAGAVQRAACGATLARADLVRAEEIADTLAAAAAGIDDVRATLGRRLSVVDITGIGGLSIPQVRKAFDDGDVGQKQADAWSMEIRAEAELVAAAAADTYGYMSSILGVTVSILSSVPTVPFPHRVDVRMVREIAAPVTDSTYPSQLELVDVGLRLAAAAGSIAENFSNIVGAGIEAVAAWAPELSTGPDQEGPDQSGPTAEARVSDAGSGASLVQATDDAGPQSTHPVDDGESEPGVPVAVVEDAETPTEQPGADPVGVAAPPAPSPPPPPDTGAESGLALLADG